MVDTPKGIASVLRSLGLSDHESAIYLALIDLGPAGVSAIARRARLYRPIVYKGLAMLMGQRLVSRLLVGKRAVYAAESPAALDRIVDHLHAELNHILPELLDAHARNEQKTVIRFYEGRNGLAQVFDDVIATVKAGDAIYRYESPKDYQRNKRYYPKLYIERASGHRGILERFVITNKKTHETRVKRLERLSKFVPPEFDPFEYDITQIIYGDNVAFVDYQTVTASVIESASFAKFQRQIFKLLFSKL